MAAGHVPADWGTTVWQAAAAQPTAAASEEAVALEGHKSGELCCLCKAQGVAFAANMWDG